METGKPLTVKPVKVASAAVVESQQKAAPQEEVVLDDLTVGGDGDGSGVVIQEESAGDETLFQDGGDDDIFGSDEAFVSNPAKNALSELEVDVDDVGAAVAVGLDAEDGVGDEVVVEEDAEEGSAAFQIYSHNCLRCTELVPGLKKSEYIKARAFTKCHYENGNKDCPAKSVQIVVGLPIPTIVKSYMAAFVDGDNEKIALIQAKLATKDEGQRQLANDAIKRAMAKHFANTQ